MTRLVRGFVILTAACALFAMVAATVVLRHGSGTYTALVVFMPLLVAPGIGVWIRPKAETLSLWAFWAFLSSIFYLIGGSPNGYERELAGWAWPWVAWATWLTITLAFIGSTVVSFLASASNQPHPPATLRTRRVQQGVQMICALAVISMGVTLFVLDLPPGATMFMASALVFIVAPAPYVYRTARRGVTIFWACWTSPFAALAWLLSLEPDGWVELPLRVTLMSYGTLMAMIIVVLPLVSLVSSDNKSDLPIARVQ